MPAAVSEDLKQAEEKVFLISVVNGLSDNALLMTGQFIGDRL